MRFHVSNRPLTAAAYSSGKVWVIGAYDKKSHCCDLPLAMDATIPAGG